jgi:hypothetical protein
MRSRRLVETKDGDITSVPFSFRYYIPTMLFHDVPSPV